MKLHKHSSPISLVSFWHLHGVLLTVLLINFVEVSGIAFGNEENNNAAVLDYVRLNYQSRLRKSSDEEGDVTWNIGEISSCSQLQPGCFCDNSLKTAVSSSKSVNGIVCTCSDATQVFFLHLLPYSVIQSFAIVHPNCNKSHLTFISYFTMYNT